MVSRLIFEPILCFGRHWIFCELTPTGNSHINIGKSRDEFKSEMKPGTWWTPITLCKEDIAHSWRMEEPDEWIWAKPIHGLVWMYKPSQHYTMEQRGRRRVHKTKDEAEGPTKWQDQRSKKMTWQKDEKEKVRSRKQEAHE